MILPGNGEDGDYQNHEKGPDEARHGVEVVAQKLQGKAARVADGNVVAEDREHEEHKTELRPTQGVVYFSDEAP